MRPRAPRRMYISVDDPTRSVRSRPRENGRRILLVGGEGHKPGNERARGRSRRRLRRGARGNSGTAGFKAPGECASTGAAVLPCVTRMHVRKHVRTYSG